jgi:hypothetical protein
MNFTIASKYEIIHEIEITAIQRENCKVLRLLQNLIADLTKGEIKFSTIDELRTLSSGDFATYIYDYGDGNITVVIYERTFFAKF